MSNFREMEEQLRRAVRDQRPSGDERNDPEFRAARIAAGGARAAAFARATQGKGKPGSMAVYGTGKPARVVPEPG